MVEIQYSGIGTIQVQTCLTALGIILIKGRSAESEVHISEPRQVVLWNLYGSCVFSFSTKHIESSWFLNVLAPEVVCKDHNLCRAARQFIISSEGFSLYCSELRRSAGMNTFSPRALKPKQEISVEENGV